MRAIAPTEPPQGLESSVHLKMKQSQPSKSLACPFYKHHAMHQDSLLKPDLFDSCLSGWHSISRLKEHLYRRHMPKWMCARCRHDFDSEAELRGHQNAHTACDKVDPKHSKHPFAIDEPTHQRLRARKRKMTIEDSWYHVWSILFDDSPKPSSPYLENNKLSPKEIDQAQVSLECLLEKLPTMLSKALGDTLVEGKDEDKIRACLLKCLQTLVAPSLSEDGRSIRGRSTPCASPKRRRLSPEVSPASDFTESSNVNGTEPAGYPDHFPPSDLELTFLNDEFFDLESLGAGTGFF